MQYKGFKMMKRAAAVIVSAAIMLADMQGVSATGFEQMFEVETMEAETVEDSAQTGMDEGLPVEALDAEAQTVEFVEAIQTADEAVQPEIIEAETTQTEAAEKAEAESTQDAAEETKNETPETKAEETEQMMSEAEEPTDASEVTVDDEVVADSALSQINFYNYADYADPDKNYITGTGIAISINDPVTIAADFSGFQVPEGAKVQWDSNDVTPTYVKWVQSDIVNVRDAIKLEGLKPTEKPIKITCVVSNSAGTPIAQGDFDVTVNPFATQVSINVGNTVATGKEVIYSYVSSSEKESDNKFVAVGGELLPEADQTVSGFTASVSPINARQDVTWMSSNPSIIRFSDKEQDKYSGEIEVRGEGEVTITAKATDGSNIVGTVKVKVRRLITGFSFEIKPADKNNDKYEYTKEDYEKNKTIPIAAGTSITLTPKTIPDDATLQRITYSWKGDNNNGLSLSVNDRTNVLTVTAKSGTSGMATLTATTTDMSEIERNLRFEIIPKVESITILSPSVDADKIEYTDVTGKNIGYDPTTYTSDKPNNVYIFKAKASPDGALGKVNWKISNSKIAEVEVLEDNSYQVKIDPTMTGTAVITATATDGSNISASTTLRITELATGVEIQGSKVVMKGKTVKLTANVSPKTVGNVKFNWESYNPAIASVNPATGEVTGKALGYAIIKVTAMDGSEKYDKVTIQVTDPPKEFDITYKDNVVTGKTVGLDPDDDKYISKNLAIKILPETASQNVEWKSSNEKIVTCEEILNSNGQQIITAKGIGTATITAKALDGSGKTASIKVNVNTLATGVTITGGHYVAKDMTLQLKAEIANKDAANKSVIWKSDSPKIAEVDERGLVTAVGKDGMARITAEAADGSGESWTHDVYVVSKPNKVEIYGKSVQIDKNTLEFGVSDLDTDTVNLEAVLRDGYDIRDNFPREIKWSTSSKSIATVEASGTNSSEATVKIYKKGTVTITATTTEGFESSASVTIKVKDVRPTVEITGAGKRLARGKKMKLSVGSVLVDWESDSPDIAKVSNKGQVTADKYGDGWVRISATPVNGGTGAACDIFVGDPVQNIDLTINGKKIEEPKKKIGVDIVKGFQNNAWYGNNGASGTGIKLGATLNFEGEGPEYDSRNVTWKSSNKGIAEIDAEGVVTLKKKGNVTFTAAATDGSNKKAKVTFVVSKQMTEIYPIGCRETKEKDIYVGYRKSIQLSKEIEYRPLAATKPKLVWEIEDESDAVSVGKNNGKVTGKIEDDFARIKVMDANNEDIYCYFRVHVVSPVNKVEIVKVENGKPADYQSVVGIDLNKGDTLSLTTNLYAKEDDEGSSSLNGLSNKPVTWSSSNKAIAEVSEDGLVTAHKSGEVTITATATDGSKKKGKIKVCCGKLVTAIKVSKKIEDDKGIYLDLGKKNQKVCDLASQLTITPVTATNKKLTYTSTDKTVVTVNAKGKVTAKGVGPAEIIVTSKDGGCSIPISVYVDDSSDSGE